MKRIPLTRHYIISTRELLERYNDAYLEGRSDGVVIGLQEHADRESVFLFGYTANQINAAINEVRRTNPGMLRRLRSPQGKGQLS